MEKFKFKKVCPFKWFVLENFPFIEADFDALTNWELFCKLGYEMNKIIKSNNQIGVQMESLTDAFISLQDYINNYFDNLDVQEEINNKLDDMAESGTLTEIIAQYLSLAGVFGFDTIENMQNATNLVSGSICRTLGKDSYNDGLGNFYRVRDVLNTDVIDGYDLVALSDVDLVAERIVNWKKVQYFIVNNTMSESDIIKIIEINDKEKVIEFENGTYIFTEDIHLKSNTKFILNDSTLHFEYDSENIKIFGYEPDSTYTEYNGKSNIEFLNGRIETGFAFMHNTNVTFKNIIFSDATGHSIQIGGCKDFTISNCTFNPSYERESYETNEILQLETSTRNGQPFLTDENSISYDNTPNENIIIINNVFKAGDNEDTFSYSFIGNHAGDTEHNYFNTNIIIKDNIFEDTIYGKITLYGADNIQINNNKFVSTNAPSTNANIRFRSYNKNIEIKNNIFTDGVIGIINVNPQTIENIVIDNNKFDISEDNSIGIELQGTLNATIINNYIKTKKWAFYLSEPSSLECKNVIISENIFDRTSSTDNAIKLYNGTNILINNNKILMPNATYYFIDSDKDTIDYTIIDNDFTITNNAIPKIATGNINYKKIYQGLYNCYVGNGTYSAITNQSALIQFSNFNRLYLLLHKSGDSSIMKMEYVLPYSPREKLSNRSYGLVFVENSTPHYGLFKINSDGTFNFSTDGGFTLRQIFGFNEISHL